MKHDTLLPFTWFVSGMASGISICLLVLSPYLHSLKSVCQVETSTPTNAIVETTCFETNRAIMGNQNVNWFKDNSNFIWDGWKIK